MITPSDARTRPENQSRDWDAQTVDDSDPAARLPSQEKSIDQLENPPLPPNPTRPTSNKEASTAGSFSALALANTSPRSPSRMEPDMGSVPEVPCSALSAGTPGATLSVIGSLQNAAFVSGKFGDRYATHLTHAFSRPYSGYKMFIAAGCIVVFVGQLLAAFCTSLWSIFLTQGVLQGVGCGLLLPMVFALPSQWFSKRAESPQASSSPVRPLEQQSRHSSFRRCSPHRLQEDSANLLLRPGPDYAAWLPACQGSPVGVWSQQARPRDTVARQEVPRDPTFWSCWTALFFALFGYMCPFVFISVYTSEKIPAISSQLANLPIPIMSFASAIGRIGAGHVADRIGFMNAFILAITISGLSQLVLWNVAAETYAGIMVFSVVFGLTGPCFLSLVTPIAATLYGTDNLATLTGLFNIANVPGMLSGPPIGGVILDGAGHSWHALAAYSGSIQLLGVICILYGKESRAVQERQEAVRENINSAEAE
ncbi:major facilitator superfamily transporter [Rhizoctonia solani]|uniref:Major facilitator superfamily transporter n=1 Tax=Rhizoctonia solani TaxID=456999 RepID=A0A8H8SU22_9AGAM|nr:major facilitator superfamily transporter [Rhizoctonia solani]QRW18476.1 major facilitator superfamily transporter [Rhizoctonia solani]